MNTLNTSRRSCTRAWPASFRFLMTERSVSLKPGQRIALRGRLPKWNTPLAETGSANTEVELHEPAAAAAMRGSQTPVGEPLIRRADNGRVADQVGPQRRDAGERVDVRDHVERAAGLQLHDADHLPSLLQPVAAERQLVRGIDAEAMPHVEVRRPIAVGDVDSCFAANRWRSHRCRRTSWCRSISTACKTWRAAGHALMRWFAVTHRPL